MPDLITRAQPPLEFIPPAYDPRVRRVFDWVLPIVTRSRTPIRQIDAQNVEALVDLYQQFQDGKSRFLLAFRHPSVNDPFCLAKLLWRIMPATAKKQGLSFSRPHLHFIYDRGIPIWAGNWTTWLYTKLGGTPIHRGKIDLVGLRSARDLFANGAYPIMAAPEGATNGHTEVISPLEPGIAQLGFWCVEDLHKANRPEQVFILPVGIQYQYIAPPWDAIAQVLSQLESDSGLPVGSSSKTDEITLYQRLYRLGEHLLVVMESYYRRFFHKNLAATATPLSNEDFAIRLNALLNAALEVAEEHFALTPKGSVIDRCRRLEQAAWDCIYRDDLKLETVSPLERGLADRVAEEADLRVWHMRLVESFVAVTGKYVQEKPSVERFAETTLLAWDMLCRIKGGNPFNRPKLGAQKAMLIIGQPINVSDRWETYQGGRKNAKQSVETLTKDLQTALEAML
jgi:1-acyl-sn-glycerol-3-phosphate acyltransferase